MQRNISLLAFPALLALMLAGCSKEPIDHLNDSESRIYITNHDSTVNFAHFKTFSIADSVAVIMDNQLQKKALTDVDAAYINAVKTDMQQMGYTMVGNTDNPDLGITVSRVYNSYSGVISYPDYWADYYGYWDPYYWGYPGYSYYFPPVFYGVYQVQEGALSIDMLDLKDAGSSNKQIKGVWSGLIRGSGVFTADAAAGQVKMLFDQSAYLKTNS